MKIRLVKLGLILILAILAISSNSLCYVVINEVELNPPGNDQLKKTNYIEYVELYNDEMGSVNIGGWYVMTKPENESVKFPLTASIEPSGYYRIVMDGGRLVDTNETVILYNSDGVEIDRTPALTDEVDDENSWRRVPDGRDTDTTDDWKFMLSSPSR